MFEQALALPDLLLSYEGHTPRLELATVPVPKEIADPFDKLARTADQEAITHCEFAASFIEARPLDCAERGAPMQV